VDLQQLCTRQSRRAILWGIGSFVVFQLGLTLAMEAPLFTLRDPAYAFKLAALRKRLAEPGERPLLVLVLGTSHVADGVCGQVVEKDLESRMGRRVIVFNFGIAGNRAVNDVLNLERLRFDGVRPDLVLAEMMPATLVELSVVQLDTFAVNRFGLVDRVRLHRMHFPLRTMPGERWYNWGLPCYSNRYESMSVLMPEILPPNLRHDRERNCDASGWVKPWYPTAPEKLLAARKDARKSNAGLLQSRLGGPFLSSMDEIVKICARERLPLGLLWMPEGSVYRGLYSPELLASLAEMQGRLAAEHNATLVNAREWVSDEHFYDTHHLLPEGATIFTTRLAEQAIEPMLRAGADYVPR
jgi:hypothetical protein